MSFTNKNPLLEGCLGEPVHTQRGVGQTGQAEKAAPNKGGQPPTKPAPNGGEIPAAAVPTPRGVITEMLAPWGVIPASGVQGVESHHQVWSPSSSPPSPPTPTDCSDCDVLNICDYTTPPPKSMVGF